MRWMNNDAVGDVAAGGAVSRDGLVALDPQNGMPLDWKPDARPRCGSLRVAGDPHRPVDRA
jgi:hypothetical protein